MDGKKIVFGGAQKRVASYEIFTMKANGKSIKKLTDNDYWDDNASWSPDGKKIVFDSERENRDYIYVMNADGSGEKRLTNEEHKAYTHPSWSPNGGKIVFISGPYRDNYK